MCKEKIYNLIAHSGIWFLGKFFPEYFARQGLKPTDRYIEYPFVMSNLYPHGRILDVGCVGSFFPLILKATHNYEVWGIDIRDYPLTGFNFIKGDIRKTDFENNFFSYITAISTIEHIGLSGRYGIKENVEADIEAIEEIYRILEPYGLFLMTVPFGESYRITKNHRIYNEVSLKDLLCKFKFIYQVVKSPEADYNLALIKAEK